MHYSPSSTFSTSDVVGFEALMRWEHPIQGWVPPDVFIPLAEQSDLILLLGAFAIHESVTAAAAWEATGWSIRAAVRSRLISQRTSSTTATSYP